MELKGPRSWCSCQLGLVFFMAVDKIPLATLNHPFHHSNVGQIKVAGAGFTVSLLWTLMHALDM